MAGANPPKQGQDLSASGAGLTISLSTIIAAIWAGIWGFNWAASHLDGGALFVSILIGLVLGVVLTYVLVNRAFNTVDTVEHLYYRALAEAVKQGHDPSSIPMPPTITIRVAKARPVPPP